MNAVVEILSLGALKRRLNCQVLFCKTFQTETTFQGYRKKNLKKISELHAAEKDVIKNFLKVNFHTISKHNYDTSCDRS